jgi:hypothetical protein
MRPRFLAILSNTHVTECWLACQLRALHQHRYAACVSDNFTRRAFHSRTMFLEKRKEIAIMIRRGRWGEKGSKLPCNHYHLHSSNRLKLTLEPTNGRPTQHFPTSLGCFLSDEFLNCLLVSCKIAKNYYFKLNINWILLDIMKFFLPLPEFERHSISVAIPNCLSSFPIYAKVNARRWALTLTIKARLYRAAHDYELRHLYFWWFHLNFFSSPLSIRSG